jgi:hypothetical protein
MLVAFYRRCRPSGQSCPRSLHAGLVIPGKFDIGFIESRFHGLVHYMSSLLEFVQKAPLLDGNREVVQSLVKVFLLTDEGTFAKVQADLQRGQFAFFKPAELQSQSAGTQLVKPATVSLFSATKSWLWGGGTAAAAPAPPVPPLGQPSPPAQPTSGHSGVAENDDLSFDDGDVAFVSHLDSCDSLVTVLNCRDVVLRICSFLDVESLIQMSSVSNHLRFITTHHQPLWHMAILPLLESHPFLQTTWFVCDDSSLQLGPYPVSRRLCYDPVRSSRLIPRLSQARLAPPPSPLVYVQAIACKTGVPWVAGRATTLAMGAGGAVCGGVAGLGAGLLFAENNRRLERAFQGLVIGALSERFHSATLQITAVFIPMTRQCGWAA